MADSTAIDGVLGAANAEVRLSVAGFGGVAIQVQGTFSGTITFEASVQGQDFTAFRVTPPNSSTPATTTTTTGVWVGSVVGYLVIRARMSSYSSGQATVLLRADVPSPGGAGGGGGSGSDVNLIEVGGSTIALGQAAMAASLPVVLASDQTAVDVNIVGGGGSGGTSSTFGAAFPATGTAIGVADPDGNMAALSAETLDYDTGAGTAAQTIIGIALPASGGPVAGGTTTNPLQVGDAGGSLTVDGPLTDVQLRATPVPVSGTVSTGGLTDAELRATPVPVSGTVTANLGTIAGVSTLSEQQTQTTALQIIDDWDESDRAKVNPIVGQAGVQAGAGAVSATTQRVVLATDTTVPNVTGSVADGTAASGNPVVVGQIAKSPDGTDPGSVAENATARMSSDLNRRHFVNTRSAWTWSFHSDGSSALTDTSVQADPGDGFQIVITEIIFSTGAATACNIFFEEGSTKILGPWYLEAVAGRGVMWRGEKKVTASTAVTVTTSAAIAQALDVQGYIQAV